MTKNLLIASVAALALATQAQAAFSPSTAKVDVRLNDVLLLSNIGGGLSAAEAAGLQAAWGTGSISEDGETLLTTFADPTKWAVNTVNDLAQFSVSSAATRTGFAPVITGPTVISQDVFSVAGGASIFAGGPLVSTSENPGGLGGDFTAHGRAEITNAFALKNLSDVSVPANTNSVSNATSNSSNTTISLDLADAATIAAINSGSSAFTIRLYINTILALIDLSTDGPGSTAFGEFALTAELTGFDSTNNGGSETVFSSASFGRTRVTGNGNDVTATLTGSGPSTGAGAGSTPFLTLAVDAATTRSIQLSLSLTTTSIVTTPVPEPASMALMLLGFAGVGAGRVLRRKSAVTAA